MLSVIVPVYNTAPWLDRCLTSIRNQTLQDLEIIVVDDGSTDESWKIIQSHAAQDKRIVALHQPNAGASEARNAGIRLATGEFIGFVDSDDSIEPEAYATMLKEAHAYQSDVVVCGQKRLSPEGTCLVINEVPSCRMNFESTDYFDYLETVFFKHHQLGLVNKLFRLSLINSLHLELLPIERVASEDGCFLLSLLPHAKRLSTVQDVHYLVTVRPGSITNQFRPMLLTKFTSLLETLRDQKAYKNRPELLTLVFLYFSEQYTAASLRRSTPEARLKVTATDWEGALQSQTFRRHTLRMATTTQAGRTMAAWGYSWLGRWRMRMFFLLASLNMSRTGLRWLGYTQVLKESLNAQ